MNTQAEPSVRQLVEAATNHARVTHPYGGTVIAFQKAEFFHDFFLEATAELRASTQSQRAEIERLRAALLDIADCTDPDKDGNYRSDDREGCLDAVFSTARAALTQPTKETQ